MSLVRKLRKCLTHEEFIEVTEFAGIYTKDNAVKKVDDMRNFSEDWLYYTSITKFVEMLQDMYVDILGEYDVEDLEKKQNRKWIIMMSGIIRKLRIEVQKHEY